MLHRCADHDCPYVGQPSPKGCACHKTDEQVLRDSNAELLAALKGLIAFAEDAETKLLVGDEGCIWPVEEARYAIATAEGLHDLG